MIPKIIHYTWFSGEDMPDLMRCCVASWKSMLPDYVLKKWDMNSIKNIDSIFLKEAIAEKRWAYAADFIRLYAIYNEGGIYLDTDAQVFKSFDPFLDYKAFIGREFSFHKDREVCNYVTSHCFGAEKGHPFIKECLDYFDERHFKTSKHTELPPELRYNLVLLPKIQAYVARQYGYDWRLRANKIQNCEKGLVIFPKEYFDGHLYEKKIIVRHWAVGSWRDIPIKLYDERHTSFKLTLKRNLHIAIDKLLERFNCKIIKI